jgi:hypothetical protein
MHVQSGRAGDKVANTRTVSSGTASIRPVESKSVIEYTQYAPGWSVKNVVVGVEGVGTLEQPKNVNADNTTIAVRIRIVNRLDKINSLVDHKKGAEMFRPLDSHNCSDQLPLPALAESSREMRRRCIDAFCCGDRGEAFFYNVIRGFDRGYT